MRDNNLGILSPRNSWCVFGQQPSEFFPQIPRTLGMPTPSVPLSRSPAPLTPPIALRAVTVALSPGNLRQRLSGCGNFWQLLEGNGSHIVGVPFLRVRYFMPLSQEAALLHAVIDADMENINRILSDMYLHEKQSLRFNCLFMAELLQDSMTHPRTTQE